MVLELFLMLRRITVPVSLGVKLSNLLGQFDKWRHSHCDPPECHEPLRQTATTLWEPQISQNKHKIITIKKNLFHGSWVAPDAEKVHGDGIFGGQAVLSTQTVWHLKTGSPWSSWMSRTTQANSQTTARTSDLTE